MLNPAHNDFLSVFQMRTPRPHARGFAERRSIPPLRPEFGCFGTLWVVRCKPLGEPLPSNRSPLKFGNVRRAALVREIVPHRIPRLRYGAAVIFDDLLSQKLEMCLPFSFLPLSKP